MATSRARSSKRLVSLSRPVQDRGSRHLVRCKTVDQRDGVEDPLHEAQGLGARLELERRCHRFQLGVGALGAGRAEQHQPRTRSGRTIA